MYSTAELIEAKFLERIEKIEEAAKEVASLDEAAGSKKSFALIVEVSQSSETLKLLKIEGDWSLERFGKALLKKFPEDSLETKRLVDKQIWRRFRDEVSEVSTADSEAMKKAFRGAGAVYYWYPDLLEWHVSVGRAGIRKLSEVA